MAAIGRLPVSVLITMVEVDWRLIRLVILLKSWSSRDTQHIIRFHSRDEVVKIGAITMNVKTFAKMPHCVSGPSCISKNENGFHARTWTHFGKITCHINESGTAKTVYTYFNNRTKTVSYLGNTRVQLEKLYYRDGKLHRDNGPSRIIVQVLRKIEEWHQNGVLHRIDGPAYIKESYIDKRIVQKWYHNGIIIRERKIGGTSI